MEQLELLITQIELSTNDYAHYIFGEIAINILTEFLVLILFLYFVSLALTFLKNI